MFEKIIVQRCGDTFSFPINGNKLESVLTIETIFCLFDHEKSIFSILFGPGFAVRVTGWHGVQYLSKVSSHRPHQGRCSLDGRSIYPGCNHHGD